MLGTNAKVAKGKGGGELGRICGTLRYLTVCMGMHVVCIIIYSIIFTDLSCSLPSIFAHTTHAASLLHNVHKKKLLGVHLLFIIVSIQ